MGGTNPTRAAGRDENIGDQLVRKLADDESSMRVNRLLLKEKGNDSNRIGDKQEGLLNVG